MYAVQEATFRNGHEITDWFQIGKGIHQGCILPPCLFNLAQSTLPGSCPGGSRVIRREDRVGKEKLIYLIRNIKRLRGNSIVGNFSGEKRLNNLVYVESQ